MTTSEHSRLLHDGVFWLAIAIGWALGVELGWSWKVWAVLLACVLGWYLILLRRGTSA